MSNLEDISASAPERNRFEITLDYYQIGLAVLMLLLGLRQWAIIIGVLNGGLGTFEAMPQEPQIATMYFAVVDLVAAIGLWLRTAWGRVLFTLAAVSEIVLHTAFIDTYGGNFLAVVILAVTLVVFAGLMLAATRLGPVKPI